MWTNFRRRKGGGGKEEIFEDIMVKNCLKLDERF